MRVVVLAGLFFGACESDPMALRVPSGEWGGQNIELQVTDLGASARFKCGAVGTLGQPLTLDGAAHFSVDGTYDPVLVLGGPRSAVYSGSLSGSHLLLTVTIGQDGLGPFDLAPGQAGAFSVCNFG